MNTWYNGRFLQYGSVRQSIDLLFYWATSRIMAACARAVTCLVLGLQEQIVTNGAGSGGNCDHGLGRGLTEWVLN
jgi:hypothetical protein